MRNKTGLYLSYIIAAVLVVFICLSESIAQNPDFDQFGLNAVGPSEGSKKVRDSILELFKPLIGTITDVENGLVTIRIENEKSIMQGMRFSVFRKGVLFRHPVTQEPIGEIEDLVGRIEVVKGDVSTEVYHCTIISGEIKAGDTVRTTSSKIKLAFFQDRKSNWSLSEAFYNSLKESGRFEILESFAPDFRPEELSEIARGLGAEAVLVFSTPMRKEKKFVNVKVYWARDSKLFKEIEESAGHKTIDEIPDENKFMFNEAANMEPWGSFDLSEGQLFAIGDVDNNGTSNFIISHGSEIRIYDLISNELHELWHLKGVTRGKHISVDVLDLNDNGIPEIFVTSFIANRVSSFVIEYGSTGYRKISEKIPYFFRVIGKKLLMQKFRRIRFFSGPVYEGEWQDNKYQSKRALDLPSDVNIYGFTYIDWQNNSQKQLMTFDDKGYLNLYDEGGELIWKSGNSYGIFDLSFTRKTLSIVNDEDKWLIRGNPISVQTDRGSEILAVNRVPNVKNMPGLGSRGGEVYSLWWDGNSMDEKLIINEMPGSITDYWVEGEIIYFIARSGTYSAVKNIVTGEFSRGSQLYYYNFGDK